MSDNLLEDTEKLKNIFNEAIISAEKYLNKESLNLEDYKKIKNRILELEQDILSLTSISINNK
jgi:hypothetical protein